MTVSLALAQLDIEPAAVETNLDRATAAVRADFPALRDRTIK
ncbi:hypothetical protein [Halalkalirubrum salinum]|nr:hypothetical protein [Halalkalirubrum salinum]